MFYGQSEALALRDRHACLNIPPSLAPSLVALDWRSGKVMNAWGSGSNAAWLISRYRNDLYPPSICTCIYRNAPIAMHP